MNKYLHIGADMKDRNELSGRRAAILELLKGEIVTDQNHLVELLKTRYGIDTNQAVVSRDLHKLGVIKKQVNGVLSYELPVVDTVSEILRLAIVNIDHNEAMIVVSTQAGLADFVGDSIDQLSGLDLLGCLAGENVVFVAPRSINQIEKTCELLSQKIGFKRKNV